LKIARKLRLSVKEKAVSYKELMDSDEVFLTSSLVEVLPVTRIDYRGIGDGKPGQITRLFGTSTKKKS